MNAPKNEIWLIFLGLTLEKVSGVFHTFLGMEIWSHKTHLTYFVIVENWLWTTPHF